MCGWPCGHRLFVQVCRRLRPRDVKRWFAKNDLLLNADQPEVMMIGTPAQLRAASTVNTVEIARCDPRLQAVVWRPRRNGVQDVQLLHLGACFGTSGDYYLSTCSGRWPAPSSTQGWITVIQSCMAQRFRTIQKLQRVQNSLARIVLQQPRMSHALQLMENKRQYLRNGTR